MYYPLVRKALFQLDPERAHELTFRQLKRVSGTPLEFWYASRYPQTGQLYGPVFKKIQ